MSALTSGPVWFLAMLYFYFTLGMYGFQLWLPQIIASFGKTNVQTTAALSAIPAVFQAIGMVLIARHSDRKQERRWHVALSAWTAALALVAAGLTDSPFTALVALSVSAFSLWGVVGPFWALCTSSLSPRAAAGGIGLINSVGNLGGFAGPYLVGLVKTHYSSLVLALGVLASSLVIAGMLALMSKKFTRSRT